MTTPLLDQLTAIFAEAFEKIGLEAALGQVKRSDRPDLGQFQCNGAMAGAKILKKAPLAIAEDVATAVDKTLLEKVEVVAPGFINISVKDTSLAAMAQTMKEDDRLGVPAAKTPLKIVVDYGGPNVAKPLHVGHLRSSIIGESIKKTLRFLGHEVIGDVHLGDWGTQMGMMIIAVQEKHPNLPYFDENFKGEYPNESPVTLTDLEHLYPAISAKCKEDEAVASAARRATAELQKGRPGYRALWQHFMHLSKQAMQENFANLNIHFDVWGGESDSQPFIEEVAAHFKALGQLEESEGALIVPLHPDKIGEMPPLLMKKSDGAIAYGSSDITTIWQRVKQMGAHQIIYVVDQRQNLHFRQVFQAAKQGEIWPKNGAECADFGTMNGADGRPFKTRAGGVMKLQDLIEMVTKKAAEKLAENHVAEQYDAAEKADIAQKIGVAALKYADLSNHRQTNYIFDLDQFCTFEGNTGPYLLYSAVRIQSILAKAAAANLSAGQILPPKTAEERDLLLQMLALPQAVHLAAEKRAPNYLCEHVYTLAQKFSTFYAACHILAEEDKTHQASMLGLCQLCLQQINLVMDLIALSVPKRM